MRRGCGHIAAPHEEHYVAAEHISPEWLTPPLADGSPEKNREIGQILAMQRRHTRADTIAFCDTVRALRPDARFGADMIAGFPTETEAMFENSLKLVDEA